MSDQAALVHAISSLTISSRRGPTRRFLEGLSANELGYIAGYYGSRLLEQLPLIFEMERCELAAEVERYVAEHDSQLDLCSCSTLPPSNISHKMMLLLEFMCVSSTKVRSAAVLVEAGNA